MCLCVCILYIYIYNVLACALVCERMIKVKRGTKGNLALSQSLFSNFAKVCSKISILAWKISLLISK